MGKCHIKVIILFIVFTMCIFVNILMFRKVDFYQFVVPHHQSENENFSKHVKPLYMTGKQTLQMDESTLQMFAKQTLLEKTHNSSDKQNYQHYGKQKGPKSFHTIELLKKLNKQNSTQDDILLQIVEKLTISRQIKHPKKSEKQFSNQHDGPFQKSDEQNAFLYVENIGRIGNLLFNLAGAYGIARASNKELVLSVNFKKEISKILNISDFPVGYAQKNVKFMKYRYGIFEKYKAVLSNESYKVGHYIQSYRYFFNYSQELRKLFMIKESLIEASQQIFHNITNSSDVVFIGVHIRRGDLEIQTSINYGYRMAKPSFIYHAMNYYLNLIKNKTVHFIICSDSLNWAKAHISTNASNIYFSSSGSWETDFTLLTQCNHSIITVGTFGWWSAWIAGGDVIYYSDPVTPGSPLNNDFTAKDYFWPSWIGMNDTGYIEIH